MIIYYTRPSQTRQDAPFLSKAAGVERTGDVSYLTRPPHACQDPLFPREVRRGLSRPENAAGSIFQQHTLSPAFSLQRRSYKSAKQWMGMVRTGVKFGMKLGGDKPRVIAELHNFD
jgi:hypothetical protein